MACCLGVKDLIPSVCNFSITVKKYLKMVSRQGMKTPLARVKFGPATAARLVNFVHAREKT